MIKSIIKFPFQLLGFLLVGFGVCFVVVGSMLFEW